MSFIHNFIPGTKPATVLVLHGQGGDENDLLPVARALAPGAAFLSPRGKADENGASRFFARISRDEFDETEVRFRSRELAEWIAESVAKYSLDASKIYAMGFSNGASIAASVMLLQPGAIAGGLLLRPRAIIEPAELPQLNDAPVMLLAGEHDDKMPPGAGEHLARLLVRAGASVEFGIADAGHDLTPRDFAAGKGWFTKILGG